MWFGQVNNVELEDSLLRKLYRKVKPLCSSFGIDIILQYQIVLIAIFFTLKMTINHTLSAMNKFDD